MDYYNKYIKYKKKYLIAKQKIIKAGTEIVSQQAELNPVEPILKEMRVGIELELCIGNTDYILSNGNCNTENINTNNEFKLFEATVDGSIKCEDINIIEKSLIENYQSTNIIDNGTYIKIKNLPSGIEKIDIYHNDELKNTLIWKNNKYKLSGAWGSLSYTNKGTDLELPTIGNKEGIWYFKDSNGNISNKTVISKNKKLCAIELIFKDSLKIFFSEDNNFYVKVQEGQKIVNNDFKLDLKKILDFGGIICGLESCGLHVHVSLPTITSSNKRIKFIDKMLDLWVTKYQKEFIDKGYARLNNKSAGIITPEIKNQKKINNWNNMKYLNLNVINRIVNKAQNNNH